MDSDSNWTKIYDPVPNLDPQHCYSGGRILVSTASPYEAGASFAVLQAIGPAASLQPSPLLAMKAAKNQVEVAGMAAAHLRDAMAVCDWAARLEEEVVLGGANWTEVSAAQLLADYRQRQEHSMGLSFRNVSISCKLIFFK